MRRSGGRLREQVCGGGRRRLGRVRPRRLAGQPEVSEDLLHDSGILDRRQQAHPVPAPGTREHVEFEDPAQQRRPRRPLGRRTQRSGRRLSQRPRPLAWPRRCGSVSDRRVAPWNDRRPPRRVGNRYILLRDRKKSPSTTAGTHSYRWPRTRPSHGACRRRARAGWWRCRAWVGSITNTSGERRADP